MNEINFTGSSLMLEPDSPRFNGFYLALELTVQVWNIEYRLIILFLAP